MSLFEKMNSTFKEAMSRYKEDSNVLLPESTYIMKLKTIKMITGKTSGKTNILVERVVVENEENSEDTEVIGLSCKQWINTELDFSLQGAIKIFVTHFEREPETAQDLCNGLESLTNSNPMERVLITHYTNKTTGVIGANYDVLEALEVANNEVEVDVIEEEKEVQEVKPKKRKRRTKKQMKKVVEEEEVVIIDTDLEKIHKVINFFGDVLKEDEALKNWENMTKEELIAVLSQYDMEEDQEDFNKVFESKEGYKIWMDIMESNS